jgi:hypothetical protein
MFGITITNRFCVSVKGKIPGTVHGRGAHTNATNSRSEACKHRIVEPVPRPPQRGVIACTICWRLKNA